MTFSTFLVLSDFAIELLAAFNLREWAEQKLHGVKDALPDLASTLQSLGAGSSVAPVRFNCPPEITLHTLQKS